MIRFRLFRIDFYFSFTFFAIIAVFELFFRDFILPFLVVCLIHELGHIITIYLFGGKIKSVKFSGSGIRIIPDKMRYIAKTGEITVLLSGPIANIFFFIFSKILLPDCKDFAIFNLSLALFNLLPFSALDGGSILISLINLIFPEADTLRIMKALAAIILISCFISVFFISSSISFIPVIAACCICEIFFSQ